MANRTASDEDVDRERRLERDDERELRPRLRRRRRGFRRHPNLKPRNARGRVIGGIK